MKPIFEPLLSGGSLVVILSVIHYASANVIASDEPIEPLDDEFEVGGGRKFPAKISYPMPQPPPPPPTTTSAPAFPDVRNIIGLSL